MTTPNNPQMNPRLLNSTVAGGPVSEVRLRDLFAGLAMQEYLAFPWNCDTPHADIAAYAYRMADAMLAARQQTQADDDPR